MSISPAGRFVLTDRHFVLPFYEHLPQLHTLYAVHSL